MNLVAARVDGEMLAHRGEATAFTARRGLCTPFSLPLLLLDRSVLFCIFRRPRLLPFSRRFRVVSVQVIGTYVANRWGFSAKTNEFDNALFSGVANDSHFGVCFGAIVPRDGILSHLL